jgi:hypothetical protein
LGEGGAIVTLKVRLRADVGPDEGVLTSGRSKFMSTGKNGVANGGSKGGDACCPGDREENVVEGALVGCELRDAAATGEEGGSSGVAEAVTLDVIDGAAAWTWGRKEDVHMG